MALEGGGDDITIGELARSIQGLRADLAAYRAETQAQMAQMVSLQLYQSEMAALSARVAGNETKLERIDEERDRWRLAIFTAVVAPIVVALIVGAFALKGVG